MSQEIACLGSIGGELQSIQTSNHRQGTSQNSSFIEPFWR